MSTQMPPVTILSRIRAILPAGILWFVLVVGAGMGLEILVSKLDGSLHSENIRNGNNTIHVTTVTESWHSRILLPGIAAIWLVAMVVLWRRAGNKQARSI